MNSAIGCASSWTARLSSASIHPTARGNLLTILAPGDMFGELSFFDPGPRTVSAVAVTDVKVATMDRTALSTWISKRPEITEQLLQVLAHRLRRTNDSLADLIFTDVPARVAKAPLQLARQFGIRAGGDVRVTLDLTQEELAQLVGASLETVNKVLTNFGQRGWLRLEGKSVVLLDPGRLSHRAPHGRAGRLKRRPHDRLQPSGPKPPGSRHPAAPALHTAPVYRSALSTTTAATPHTRSGRCDDRLSSPSAAGTLSPDTWVGDRAGGSVGVVESDQ